MGGNPYRSVFQDRREIVSAFPRVEKRVKFRMTRQCRRRRRLIAATAAVLWTASDWLTYGLRLRGSPRIWLSGADWERCASRLSPDRAAE